MKVFPKVPRLSFLIVFAAIVSGRAKAQQQEANRAGEALYKQRCAAWRQTALGCSRCRRRTSGLLCWAEAWPSKDWDCQRRKSPTWLNFLREGSW